MRIVLGTNVWVSGLLWTGPPWQVLRLAEQGRIRIIATPSMIDEILGVLARPKFRGRLQELRLPIPAIREYVLSLVTLVPDPPSTTADPIVPDDPDDDMFLLCAAAAGARCVVSGDRFLLEASGYGGIPVVTASEFLSRWPER